MVILIYVEYSLNEFTIVDNVMMMKLSICCRYRRAVANPWKELPQLMPFWEAWKTSHMLIMDLYGSRLNLHLESKILQLRTSLNILAEVVMGTRPRLIDC
jgi:hypothetical protein